MPIKDAIRTCKCKYCEKKFTMFRNSDGELIFFPENTTRPAWGYYEMLDHIRKCHPEIFNLYSFLTKLFKENVEECYEIS
jgi:hypothetical protein